MARSSRRSSRGAAAAGLVCAACFVFAVGIDGRAAFAAMRSAPTTLGGSRLSSIATPGTATPALLAEGPHQRLEQQTSFLPAAAVGLVVGLAAVGASGLRKRSSDVRSVPGILRRAQMQPNLPDAGIAVMDKVDMKTRMKEEFEKEKWWRVLLHNDDIHTFEYVTNCLTKVVQHLTRRKAYNITWEAHSSGKATVACVWKALAEQFCVKLQQDGLTVSIAPDSKFEGNKGGQ
ncbi:unnamed protein product [Polarella glacialis]|uniref:Adaptor protein ClpS core domain-containing protein n=1 Tax=Polarella glacialis TaxID=89957 RepID=A0A813J9Y2_POLGL|nr:unnamed protein product [Polarella glacialis]CAE8726235.1 unnamed protein product [Polarella glacialis]